MLLSTTSNRLDSIAQLITAVLIFIFIIVLAYFTTKFTAGFQKSKMVSPNVEIVETFHLAQNKYIQIVRVGTRYYSIVVCKDTVTMLGELDKDDITIPETGLGTTVSFKEILDKAKGITHKK